MNYTIIIKSIIFVFIFSTILFSQEEYKTSVELDSLRIKQKINLMLHDNLKYNLPLYSLSKIVDPYESFLAPQFSNNYQGSMVELNFSAMNKIKSNINQSFSVYRSGQNKYHLGIISDVLGYVSTAAAAGLAAYHVYKYRKKYGFK